MKNLPYFCWYPADAETDAGFRAMDDADIGFYIRCLNHAWINGGIPADSTERARVLRTRKDTADKRWLRVGKCFVTSTSDTTILVNPRQEVEREHAKSKSVKASESAKARYERNADALPRAYDSVSDSVSKEKETSFPPLREVSEFPLTRAELAKHDPAVDEIFVRRLVQETAQHLISHDDMGEFDDEDVAKAIRESYATYAGRNAHGNGLLLSRVPRIIHNWGKNEARQ